VSDNDMNDLIRSAAIRKRERRLSGVVREPEPEPEPIDYGAGPRATPVRASTSEQVNRWIRQQHHRAPLAETTVEVPKP
jgi:hypothetical protein